MNRVEKMEIETNTVEMENIDTVEDLRQSEREPEGGRCRGVENGNNTYVYLENETRENGTVETDGDY